MRQAMMVMLLAGIMVSMMQCSDNESLNNLQGGYKIASMRADTLVRFTFGPFPPNTAVYPAFMAIDSIVWMNETPSGGPSRLSLIIHAADTVAPFMFDLGVETYTGSVPGTVTLVRDSMGVFNDTVLIAASNRSGVILPAHDSRLFVSYSGQVIDTIITAQDTTFDTVRFNHEPLETIPLVNPW